ncbi:MAG: ethylbenzene dehydrogenase-related protein [Dehalococcoidia bacterium]
MKVHDQKSSRISLTHSFVGNWKNLTFMLSVVSLLVIIVFFTMTPVARGSSVTPPHASKGQQPPAVAVEAGEQVYLKRCASCHGEKGDGNGPAAPYLNPRPRDFTLGMFKLRTTSSGEPPLDSDLIETVKKGIPGTSMPRWEGTLSDEEIENTIVYIKTFAPDIFDPSYTPEVVEVGEPPAITTELIARGKEVYDSAECWKCHGLQGKANGEDANALEDDWGYPIRALNLTKGWRYKRDNTVKDIYTRFSTGMDGTPMPSYLFDLEEDDRWALAAYTASLISEEPDTSQVVLRSLRIAGELPTDPNDPQWTEAPALDVLLTGQVIVRPRWENISVDLLTVKSVYNEQEVAFLLQWDDPFEDIIHQVGADDDIGLKGTYVDWDIYGKKLHSYGDAVAMQLPQKLQEGPRKPHFLWGTASDPVNLWLWQADGQRVQEMMARGPLVKQEADSNESSLTELMDQLLTRQPPESQNLIGQGVWNEGTWKVILKRTLDTGDAQDIRLEIGQLTPVAFQVWDGSNGERNLMMSISSWHFLLLETSTPLSTYLYSIGAVLVAVGLEGWLVWRLRRRGSPQPGGYQRGD